MLDRCANVRMANISVITLGQIVQLISYYCALLLWQLLGTVSDGIALGWEGSEERGCSKVPCLLFVAWPVASCQTHRLLQVLSQSSLVSSITTCSSPCFSLPFDLLVIPPALVQTYAVGYTTPSN